MTDLPPRSELYAQARDTLAPRIERLKSLSRKWSFNWRDQPRCLTQAAWDIQQFQPNLKNTSKSISLEFAIFSRKGLESGVENAVTLNKRYSSFLASVKQQPHLAKSWQYDWLLNEATPVERLLVQQKALATAPELLELWQSFDRVEVAMRKQITISNIKFRSSADFDTVAAGSIGAWMLSDWIVEEPLLFVEFESFIHSLTSNISSIGILELETGRSLEFPINLDLFDAGLKRVDQMLSDWVEVAEMQNLGAPEFSNATSGPWCQWCSLQEECPEFDLA
jgi:hypothetical protein